jgi:lipoate-protein ligase A
MHHHHQAVITSSFAFHHYKKSHFVKVIPITDGLMNHHIMQKATMAFFASCTRQSKAKLSWLDLRGTGLSAIERLCLEEALLRHDPEQQCWAIVGAHEPTTHRMLRNIPLPPYIQEAQDVNKSCVIVMGIGGKPELLLNMDLVRNDGVLVVKRFSGGGTVVLDHSSLWTTFIGRNEALPHVQAFPRPIMKWAADAIFEPAFFSLSQQALLAASLPSTRSTLVADIKSCSATENSGKTIQLPNHDVQTLDEIPQFALVETDYVLGERKMGGNAQTIAGQNGWLHHTSFLWDYDDDNMEYLSLPSKQPDYRENRSHEDFLVKLSTYYGSLKPTTFFEHVKQACKNEFEVEDATLKQALAIVDNEVGGMQNWFETKCRTKIVTI